MSYLEKKLNNFSNTDNNKKYYEEFKSRRKLLVNDFRVKIPKLAPDVDGFNVTDPTLSLEPKDFTSLDNNCPPGFKNYTATTYPAFSKVYYAGRYWINKVSANSSQNPLNSLLWQDITEIALSHPLRKRYKVQTAYIPGYSDGETNSLNFAHNSKDIGNFIPISSITPLMVSTINLSDLTNSNEIVELGGGMQIKLNTLQINISEFTSGNIREIVEYDEIYIPSLSITAVVTRIDWNLAAPHCTLFVKNKTNNGITTTNLLPSLIVGNEMFQLIKKQSSYMSDSVDFSFDITYNHYVEKNNGDELAFGVYEFDGDAGIVTFFSNNTTHLFPSNVTENLPVRISLYQIADNYELTKLQTTIEKFNSEIIQLDPNIPDLAYSMNIPLYKLMQDYYTNTQIICDIQTSNTLYISLYLSEYEQFLFTTNISASSTKQIKSNIIIENNKILSIIYNSIPLNEKLINSVTIDFRCYKQAANNVQFHVL
jgi:hypothetical protein